MPFTSSCPKCQKQVTVPDHVGAASLVRCPLCEAEFELREALALGPPALVIIEAKTDDGQPIVPAAVGAELPLAEAQAAPAGAADEDHWTSGWAAADATATTEPAEGEDDAVVFGAITGKLPPAEGGDGTGLPPRLPGTEEGEVVQPLPRRRRRPREEHPIRVLFGCIISGALAVFLAYWGLNLVGGAKNDKLAIRLPFCRHTYQYWCWWTPWKWHNPPPVAVEPKAVAANAAPAAPPAAATKPAVDPKKPKVPANDYPDISQKPVDTVAPKFTSKPAEKPQDKEKPKKPNPPEGKGHDAGPPKAKPPAAAKESAPKPAADRVAEPPAKEEPKVESSDLDDGMPTVPDIIPKPGQATAPDALPVPVKPRAADDSKETPAKPEKPETPEAPERPETPAKPETPAAPAPAAAIPAQPESPAAPPANLVGPIHPASYGPAELAAALKAAQDSFATDITPAAYEKLRRLAEVLTLAKRSPKGALPPEQQRAIDALLRRAAAGTTQTDKIAQSAAALLAGPDPAGGILLTGTVTFVGVQEKLHGAAVRIAGQPNPVSVLSSQSLAVNKDDKVLVLGHLVREPAKNLAGYKGTQRLVVWSILAVKLP
jgi:hypothetical protein